MENNSVESVQNQFVEEEGGATASSIPVELEEEEGGATASSIPVELEEKMGELNLNLENNIRPQIKNINTDADNTNTNGIPETAPQQQNGDNITLQQQHHGLLHQGRFYQPRFDKRRFYHRRFYQDRFDQSRFYQGRFHPQFQRHQYHGHLHQQQQRYHGHLHPQQQRYHGHLGLESQLQSLSIAGVCMMNRPNQNEINRNHALAISNHGRQQLLQQHRSMATDNPLPHIDNINAHQ